MTWAWSGPGTTSKQDAHKWFTRLVEDRSTARFPLIEADGDVVTTAIGTLQVGIPDPRCRRGRAVRLANVITVPEHRGKGDGSLLVRDIGWTRSIDADHVDLSATPDGKRLDERLGSSLATAPRMTLVA